MALKHVTVALALLAAFPVAGWAAGSKPAKPATSIAEAENAFARGVKSMEAKKWDDAVAAFRQVLELEPELAEAHNNLGYCLRKTGEKHWEEALKHYDKALELDPKLAAALHYRGTLHRLAGREAEAKADHERLAKLDPNLAARLLEVIATGVEPATGDGIASW